MSQIFNSTDICWRWKYAKILLHELHFGLKILWRYLHEKDRHLYLENEKKTFSQLKRKKKHEFLLVMIFFHLEFNLRFWIYPVIYWGFFISCFLQTIITYIFRGQVKKIQKMLEICRILYLKKFDEYLDTLQNTIQI